MPSDLTIPPIPPELPIAAHAAAITRALREHPVVIVCGDTGSGKTTQLPRIALALGRERIGCTQPRRLATLAMARRVAEEFGQEPGALIGYQHRFDKRLSPETRIKFMTDGILLAETRRDRLLRAYDTLILDEAHERSLNIDFLLGILRRILPRRPDLKLLISSATLDAARFSAFFRNAPVLTVPGRLHPIETRWRPADPEDEPDLARQIAQAVEELAAEGPGDILVFLPGERDIRDAADTLNGRNLPRTEIIPLLASLPAGEQQRAFRLSPNRRIILATNVAETSVTLPGIRFVIDSGLARLSRYHPRTRVQRLQIEPISRASAEQRRGRCGRLGPGICLRLYSEEDFGRREAFTPPEIQRASLAGVILTLLDLGLGAIETFPFLDAPSPAAIRDGLRELEHLGAITADSAGAPALTPLGRQLTRLPLEPALARILLAAHHEKALADALVVIAALACDDPRRRPHEKRADADRLHARFASPVSDFAAILRLWRWYREQTAGASQAAARRLCRDAFLSYPRMRDWIDLRDQLERLCRDLQLDPSAADGGEPGLHRALLAGLLGNLGRLDPETGEYRGARGLRFALFPGSGLAQPRKERPAAPATPRHGHKPLSRDWIVAGELVDTSRLYARKAACIDPAWIEPVAGRLCSYSHHSPAWDAVHGFVRVQERVTLFGLLLVEGRARDYSRIQPAESRAIFLREGLVAGAFPSPVPPFLVANLERTRALQEAEAKTRRPGAWFDPETLCAFYDARLPPAVCNAAALRRWLREQPPEAADALLLRDADLPPADDLSRDFPEALLLEGNRLPLVYRHAPGKTEDGITCTVPATLLPTVAAWPSDWLVPGCLDEKLRWMLALLPARLRRLLQPVDETLALCRPRLIPGRAPLAEAFADALYAARSVRVPHAAWHEEACPDHLRMRFTVVDGNGRELGSGRNLETLTRLFARPASAAEGTLPPDPWRRDGLTRWDFGPLPPQVDVGRAGWPILHYPALVDSGDSVSLRLLADPAAAAAAHAAGACRLLALSLGKELRRLLPAPSLPRDIALFLRQHERTAATLGEELGSAALRETCIEGRPAIRDAEVFAARLEEARQRLAERYAARTRLVLAILHGAAELEDLLARAHLPTATREDLAEQLAWLVFPGFAAALPGARLQHLPRYLEACRVRIQRAPGNPAADLRRLAALRPLWQRYLDFTARDTPPRHDRAALDDYRWLLEEFRVSCFAQELRTAVPVSEKRLATLWEQVLTPPAAQAAAYSSEGGTTRPSACANNSSS
jgi:ATP-dependent helicase HrpA